jgi:hypothetical protein
MDCDEASELMNGDTVRDGDTVGDVEMPKRPTGWFKVHWEHGTVTSHEIAAPHSVARLELVNK